MTRHGQSTRLVSVLLVTVAAIAALITGVTVVREVSWQPTAAPEPEPDYLGDPASLASLAMPKAFNMTRRDLVDCATTRISRCFLSTEEMEVSVRAVQRVLGATQVRVAEYRHTRATIVCGSLGATSGPVMAVLVPEITNAQSTGADSWRIPDHPRYSDRIVVRFQLVNHATCQSA